MRCTLPIVLHARESMQGSAYNAKFQMVVHVPPLPQIFMGFALSKRSSKPDNSLQPLTITATF